MQGMSPEVPALYQADLYAWANQQAALLRAGRVSEADIGNIAEEIASIGRSEKRELIGGLAVLLMHLLKWRFRPRRRAKSWRLTIEIQRIELERHLADNPSLKSTVADALADAYRTARLQAARETKLDPKRFPTSCPWSYKEISDDGFWPEP